jgi:hypothetical protein
MLLCAVLAGRGFQGVQVMLAIPLKGSTGVVLSAPIRIYISNEYSKVGSGMFASRTVVLEDSRETPPTREVSRAAVVGRSAI